MQENLKIKACLAIEVRSACRGCVERIFSTRSVCGEDQIQKHQTNARKHMVWERCCGEQGKLSCPVVEYEKLLRKKKTCISSKLIVLNLKIIF